MSDEQFEQLGERELAKVNGMWQMLALLLAKYGLIGVVLAYFGYQNWEQQKQLVTILEKAIVAQHDTSAAVVKLSTAVDSNTSKIREYEFFHQQLKRTQ